MIHFIKVQAHCLRRMFWKDWHMVCYMKKNGGPWKSFCYCGFGNDGIGWKQETGELIPYE